MYRAVPNALCMRRFALYRFACGDPVLIYNISIFRHTMI